MIRVLVSACLLGERVRYNGADAAAGSPILDAWLAQGRVVRFCPEVAGGLGVPRPAAEIQGPGGPAVLEGRARVLTRAGTDVTANFLNGARQALDAAVAEGVRLAVLKDGSPSCGSGFVYDGSFSGRRTSDAGVTAALLEREGIRVFSEARLEEAEEYLRVLESRS
ncbi:MAG TPA: DUF523 domain-containing protein [Vicinamibacterales bacterium]|jgi:uncharacterized protein YbbK (DUF523 family)|nr:DUF523 domain-containing protein [Vicinamibacterales bacterium]